MVNQFEREFSLFCDTEHCRGVASGTDALRFARMATGVRPGDVVITVPHTFIATTEAISQTEVAAQVLSLPMFPGLTTAQQKRVAEEVALFEAIVANPLSILPIARA